MNSLPYKIVLTFFDTLDDRLVFSFKFLGSGSSFQFNSHNVGDCEHLAFVLLHEHSPDAYLGDVCLQEEWLGLDDLLL